MPSGGKITRKDRENIDCLSEMKLIFIRRSVNYAISSFGADIVRHFVQRSDIMR
jgi:hypothetical protein